MNNNYKEIKLLNGQIIGIILFILALFVTLLTVYNEKLQKLNKLYFWTNQESLTISLINRLLYVILEIYFVYVSIERKKLNNDDSNLQIIAAILALSTSLIILYIIIDNMNKMYSSNNIIKNI